MQDDGTMRGRSDTPERAPGARGGFRFGGGGPEWQHGLGGCESGFTIPDRTDPDIVWASCYGNEVTRYDARRGMARSVSPWMHTLDSPPNDAKYRCHWTPPLAVDPFDHDTVYYGCQVIFDTSNDGQTWRSSAPTSPRRTRAASSRRAASSATTSASSTARWCSPSRRRRSSEGLIWAGTNDGKVWYTKDGGGGAGPT